MIEICDISKHLNKALIFVSNTIMKSCKNKKRNRRIAVYAFIFILAVVIRLIYCIMYPVPSRDTYKYMRFIEEWNKTGLSEAKEPYPPLALYLLQCPSAITKCDLYKGGVGVNCFAGAITVLIVGLIAEGLLSSTKKALLIMLLVATHPTTVHLSCTFLRDGLYTLFVSIVFLSIIRLIKTNRMKYCLAGGIATSLCIFSRHEGLEIGLLAVLALLIQNVINGTSKTKKITGYFVALLLTSAMIVYSLDLPFNYMIRFFTMQKNSIETIIR